MSTGAPAWHVAASAAADADYDEILSWTAQHFGRAQAVKYSKIIDDAVAALRLGPERVGVKSLSHIGAGIFSLHIARVGRRDRHVLIFRANRRKRKIEVLRILHDSMDIARHLTEE